VIFIKSTHYPRRSLGVLCRRELSFKRRKAVLLELGTKRQRRPIRTEFLAARYSTFIYNDLV